MTHLLKRLFWWLTCAVIFFTVFAFALNNRETVVVHWFFGYYTRIQLVLLVLTVFAAGLLVGALAMLPQWWRLRSGALLALPAPAPATKAHKAKTPTSPVAQSSEEDTIDAV